MRQHVAERDLPVGQRPHVGETAGELGSSRSTTPSSTRAATARAAIGLVVQYTPEHRIVGHRLASAVVAGGVGVRLLAAHAVDLGRP